MTDDLRIYNIDQKIDDAAAALTVDEETGEIVGGAEFEKLLQQSADKVLNCARYLATRENALEAMKAHYKNTSIRIQQEEKRQSWLKQCVIRAVQALHTDTLEAEDIRVKLKKLPASVFVEDEKLIPEEFKKQKVTETIDKTRIVTALKAGQEVPGCSLSRGFRVEIK